MSLAVKRGAQGPHAAAAYSDAAGHWWGCTPCGDGARRPLKTRAGAERAAARHNTEATARDSLIAQMLYGSQT